MLYEVSNSKGEYFVDLIENCVISLYDCRNDIVINKKHYDKLEVNLANIMINNFIEYDYIRIVDNSILDL